MTLTDVNDLVSRSVAREPEIAALRALGPRAGQHPPVRAEGFEFTFAQVTDRRTGGAGPFGLKAHGPRGGIRGRLLQPHGVRTRVDRAGDRLTVPVEFEQDAVTCFPGGTPVAAPRTLQWMSVLRRENGAGQH